MIANVYGLYLLLTTANAAVVAHRVANTPAVMGPLQKELSEAHQFGASIHRLEPRDELTVPVEAEFKKKPKVKKPKEEESDESDDESDSESDYESDEESDDDKLDCESDTDHKDDDHKHEQKNEDESDSDSSDSEYDSDSDSDSDSDLEEPKKKKFWFWPFPKKGSKSSYTLKTGVDSTKLKEIPGKLYSSSADVTIDESAQPGVVEVTADKKKKTKKKKRVGSTKRRTMGPVPIAPLRPVGPFSINKTSGRNISSSYDEVESGASAIYMNFLLMGTILLSLIFTI